MSSGVKGGSGKFGYEVERACELNGDTGRGTKVSSVRPAACSGQRGLLQTVWARGGSSLRPRKNSSEGQRDPQTGGV